MVDIVSPPLVKEEGGGGENHRELFALLCSYPSLLRVRHFTSCFFKNSLFFFLLLRLLLFVYTEFTEETHTESRTCCEES